MIILSIENITKSFASHFRGAKGSYEKELMNVLNGISFSIEKGTINGLIGDNGSGKSTLFNIINGLLEPDKGKVRYYRSEKISELTEIPSYKHSRIGVVRLFQESEIFRGLSVLENMYIADNDITGERPWHIFTKFGQIKRQEKKRYERANFIFDILLGANNTLWEKRNRHAGELSIGQQRILAFARLFMNETADLFLLDEPCAGVSPDTRHLIGKMLLRVKEQGKTVLLVDHDYDFINRITDHCFYLERGKITLKNIPETLL